MDREEAYKLVERIESYKDIYSSSDRWAEGVKLGLSLAVGVVKLHTDLISIPQFHEYMQNVSKQYCDPQFPQLKDLP